MKSCYHCGRPMKRFNNRLCATCYRYKYKYNVLPSQEVLEARVARQRLDPCECGNPAIVKKTQTFGRKKETFALCADCAELVAA